MVATVCAQVIFIVTPTLEMQVAGVVMITILVTHFVMRGVLIYGCPGPPSFLVQIFDLVGKALAFFLNSTMGAAFKTIKSYDDVTVGNNVKDIFSLRVIVYNT